MNGIHLKLYAKLRLYQYIRRILTQKTTFFNAKKTYINEHSTIHINTVQSIQAIAVGTASMTLHDTL